MLLSSAGVMFLLVKRCRTTRDFPIVSKVLSSNQLQLQQTKPSKIMKNIIKLASILSLLFATSAQALEVESVDQPGLTILGDECYSLLPNVDTSVDCAKVFITGLEDSKSLVKFHFLDADGNGYVYVTERHPLLTNTYKVILWADETRGSFGKFHVSHKDNSCSINYGNLKVFCYGYDNKKMIVSSALTGYLHKPSKRGISEK
jgi:hypothetical protein